MKYKYSTSEQLGSNFDHEKYDKWLNNEGE